MILVFGATGKIGSEVVRLLAEASVAVRAFVRDPAKAQGWSGVDVVRGDLEDPASVAAALRGVGSVFLVTPSNGEQEIAVIRAAKAAGVRKVVKVSSMAADAESGERIARGHAQSEAALMASGMAWTILRPGMFAQNVLAFAESVRRSGRIVASARDGRVAPIDARDIAAVAVKALLGTRHEGKTYELTGGEAVSYADMARAIASATDREVVYVDVPLEETKRTLLARGLPEWYADELVRRQATIAATKEPVRTGDVEAVLGRPPRSFSEFARDYAAAFK